MNAEKIKKMLNRSLSITNGTTPNTEIIDMTKITENYVERPFNGTIEVSDRDSVSELLRLQFESPLVLNFASARRPGGGVRRGANAQEENLCSVSNLLLGLEANPEFYERQKLASEPEYLDLALFSQEVEFVLDANGVPLPNRVFADVLTYAAPNQNTCPALLAEQTMMRRVLQVIQFADNIGAKTLIAGAWGCGVFRNDADHVAWCFQRALSTSGGQHLQKVLFPIFGGGDNLVAFKAAFDKG